MPCMTEPRRLSLAFALGVVGGGVEPPGDDEFGVVFAKERSPAGVETLRIGNISWTSAKSESTLSILERRRRVAADLILATGLPLGLGAVASPSVAALAVAVTVIAPSVSAMATPAALRPRRYTPIVVGMVQRLCTVEGPSDRTTAEEAAAVPFSRAGREATE